MTLSTMIPQIIDLVLDVSMSLDIIKVFSVVYFHVSHWFFQAQKTIFKTD